MSESKRKYVVPVFLTVICLVAVVAGFLVTFDAHQSLKRELAAMHMEVTKAKAAVGVEAYYETTLQAVIGKLREYERFNDFTPEQITQITRIILEQSTLYADDGLTPGLILAIIEQESGFNPDAISSARAYGIMQVRRVAAQSTVERLGYTWSPDLLLDPVLNVKVGTEYLIWVHRIFMAEGVEERNEFTYSLMAYNNGPTAALRFIAGDDIVLNGEYAAAVARKKQAYGERGLE